MITRAASGVSGLDALVHGLALAMVLVMMTISPMALSAMGWNYDAPVGGAGPTRFHPVTYLAVLLYLAIALRDGNPVASVITAFARDYRLMLFFGAWALLFYHAVVNQKLPAASLIDTFLLPLMIVQAIRRLSPRTLAGMIMLVHVGFVANALLGIGEFLSGLRLTPYVAGGVLITDDWRSTALIGHPLGNALLTGCYTIILLLEGGFLRGWQRLAMIGLQATAMIAFGGRASLVLLVLFLGVSGLRALFLFLAGQRLQLRHLTVLAFLIPLVICVIGVLFDVGFFDKFLLRFTEDKGSAQARIVMFELFRGFTLPELLLGPPQQNLGHLVHIYRLEFGIESLWIAFSLFYGIIPSVLFFAGLTFFLFAMTALCQKRAWLVIGFFFIVNSTFLGIAGKTISFAMMCLLLLLLLPARPRSSSRATTLRETAQPTERPVTC
jgi:hypothetical protein